MTNTIDITNMTDRVLDRLLTVKADPTADHCCADLSKVERRQLAAAMGWNMAAPSIIYWVEAEMDDCAPDCSHN